MTKTQKLQYEVFHRVSNFGKANVALFPISSTAGQAFSDLADVANRLDALIVPTLFAAGDRGAMKAEARAALYDAMRDITRTARGLPLLGVKNVLRLPDHKTDRQVIAAAKGFIAKGEAIQEELVNLGLAPSWFVDLREATGRFAAAIDHRSTDHRRASQNQQEIVDAFTLGVHAVRRLDIVVPNALKEMPELLAGWRRDRGGALGRRRNVAKESAPAATAEPASTVEPAA